MIIISIAQQNVAKLTTHKADHKVLEQSHCIEYTFYNCFNIFLLSCALCANSMKSSLKQQMKSR